MVPVVDYEQVWGDLVPVKVSTNINKSAKRQ